MRLSPTGDPGIFAPTTSAWAIVPLVTGTLTVALLVSLTVVILLLNRREREGDLHSSRRLFHASIAVASAAVVLAFGTFSTGAAVHSADRQSQASELRTYESKLSQWMLQSFAVHASHGALDALTAGRPATVSYDGSSRLVKLVVDDHGALGLATVTK